MTSLIDGYTHGDSICTICIPAKRKPRYIRVPVKHTSKTFEHVHSDVHGPISTPSFEENGHYILFIDNYLRYTSIWPLPNKKGETCTSAYQSFQARVDAIGYKVKLSRRDNRRGEYDNKTFRYVSAARGTIFQKLPACVQHKNGVAEWMIRTITE